MRKREYLLRSSSMTPPGMGARSSVGVQVRDSTSKRVVSSGYSGAPLCLCSARFDKGISSHCPSFPLLPGMVRLRSLLAISSWSMLPASNSARISAFFSSGRGMRRSIMLSVLMPVFGSGILWTRRMEERGMGRGTERLMGLSGCSGRVALTSACR